MFQSEIAKEEINKLEVRHFEGEITVVEDPGSFREAMREMQKHDVLGFDTETKPSFKKGVNHKIALIQVASESKAWLFRVNKIGMMQDLVAFLEDEAVLKIGAGLTDDMRRLRQVVRFEPAGFLDLQKYVEAFQIDSKSLKKMVAIVLGFKISKSQQMSNWEAPALSEQQQRYAATDAWACLAIYNRLRKSIESYYD